MYYVTMRDEFMSGWGQARDLINIMLVPCDTIEQAEQIENHANDRPEMQNVKICHDAPYYSPDTHLISEKPYHELGGVWIEDGGRL